VHCPTVNGVTINDLGTTYGYLTPTNPPTGKVLGTIVFFSHSGGTQPSGQPGNESTYAADYSALGYQIIQTAWDGDWEDTGTSTKNIAYAAGRAAAFLNWVSTTFYAPIHQLNGPAGMCVQGTSAGGAAGAYTLAWYAGYSYIDKLELISSPPLSDIEEGCAVPANPAVEVCPQSPLQLGCNNTNNPLDWSQSPVYTDALSGVRTWTGDSNPMDQTTCRSTNPGGTSGAANAAWKAMSISDGAVGTFNYPQTNITAWLCSSVYNGGVMNNSSPEVQLFFQNFKNSVSSCSTDEEITGSYSTPSGNYVTLGYRAGNVVGAIEYDMTVDPSNMCVAHH
jgi:hypothetical protein